MAINLNKAALEELTGIQGIGNAYAKRIINHREEHGEFKTWEDVKEIRGFDNAMVEKLMSAGAELAEETEDRSKKQETKEKSRRTEKERRGAERKSRQERIDEIKKEIEELRLKIGMTEKTDYTRLSVDAAKRVGNVASEILERAQTFLRRA